MNKELENLIKKKKEIEEQIKEIKKKDNNTGLVKLNYDTYPCRQNEWRLSILCNTERSNERRWRGVIKDPDKKVIAQKIECLVKDLLEMKKKIESEK